MAENLNLLLVEDSPQDAELVVRELSRGGYIVTWTRVEDAESLRAQLQEKSWELIISDFSMPSFSGPAALEITKRELGLDIPFIMVSGTIGEETAVDAMRAGANDYLMKDNLGRLVPTVQRELRDALNRRTRSEMETALRDREQQLMQAQKMESVGRLTGGIAHDFNNILGVMMIHCELAMDQLEADSPIRTDIQQIQHAAQRGANLTRQLLAFSRKQVFEPSIINLNDLVQSTKQLFSRVIGEDIEVNVELEKNLRLVQVDPTQLEQVILNLVVNARDAMPKGGKITIRTRNVDLRKAQAGALGEVPAGAYVELEVMDTGCGMEPEVLQQIFEPFFTTKDTGKGTGLGLSTVYGIVRQSGGGISVQSRPQQGTKFRILIPASSEHDSKEPSSDSPTLVSKRETVLLIEDQNDLRMALKQVMELGGYHVLTARNAAEAEQHWNESKSGIDLIVTDVVMPNESGPDLIRRLVPDHHQTRVLYISGYLGDKTSEYPILDDPKCFLQKPFAPEALLEKVHKLLSQR